MSDRGECVHVKVYGTHRCLNVETDRWGCGLVEDVVDSRFENDYTKNGVIYSDTDTRK